MSNRPSSLTCFPIEIQPLTWDLQSGDDGLELVVFGVTNKGSSVSLNVARVNAWFYVDASEDEVLHALGKQFKGSYELDTESKWDFYGYHSCKSMVTKVTITSIQAFYGIRKALDDFKLYEATLAPLYRVFHYYDLQPCASFIVTNGYFSKDTCDCTLHIDTCIEYLEPSNKLDHPVLECAFDIEAFSHDQKFPKAEHPENVITHIALVFQWSNKRDEFKTILLSLAPCDKVEHCTEHLIYDTEEALLKGLLRVIHQYDPDILYSYNGDTFDCGYLYKRMEINQISSTLSRHSKVDKLNQQSFNSAAFGQSNYERWELFGRIHHDMFVYMQRNFTNLSSYSLNNVAKEYLNSQKDDVSPHMIFKSFREKDPELSKTVAEYCLQDTTLVVQLANKVNAFQSSAALSNLCSVPYQDLIIKGQQIKIFSLLHKEASKKDVIIPKIENAKEEYQGATVLTPINGLYHDPVITLDFASLYPSIIMAHNLCYMTFIRDEKSNDTSVFEWQDQNSDGSVTKHRTEFTKNTMSLCPDILQRLGQQRKQYKKDMKKCAYDSFEYMLNDKRQLACKLVMNSLYGFTAANMLPCHAIAKTVTHVGRTMIKATKEYVEENYENTTCVYGDSVGENEMVLVRNRSTEVVRIMPIKYLTLFRHNLRQRDQWCTWHEDKESMGLHDCDIWTEKGWTKCFRLIRHLIPADRLRLVEAQDCAIVVTTDHSLIRPDNSTISPAEMTIGTELMHANLDHYRGKHTGLEPCHFMGFEELTDFLPDIDIEELFRAPLQWKRDFIAYIDEMDHFDLYGTHVARLLQQILSPRESDRRTVTKISTVSNTTEMVYVYDLQTENHHFCAGFGLLVAHNTDSVFIQMKDKTLKEALDMGPVMADKVTEALFQKPILLEFEKVYQPLILITKKKYVGKLYTNPDKPDKIDSKGVILKRRDTFALARDMYAKIRDILFDNRDPQKEVEAYVCDMLRQISSGTVPLEKFSYNVKYTGEYKVDVPQQKLVDKMKRRDEASAPQPGDRVEYIYVKVPNAKNASDCVEDPAFMRKRYIKPDYSKYISQLEKPLTELLTLCISDVPRLFYPYKSQNYKKRNPHFDPKQQTLSSFFKRQKK